MTTVRIVLDDVSKIYPVQPPVHALRNANLVIEPGDFVAIEGPSGSGKSTLLNVIATLDSPTSGLLYINDVDVALLSEADRSRLRSSTFGFVFQAFHLMRHRTACENVELGLVYRGLQGQVRRAKALEALAQVGLAHRAHTVARKLSGGESQRVAIARAMVSGAPVIVADEPTGNLDSTNSASVVATLKELAARGTTVILVTHDPDVAQQASRRLAVRDGVLTESAGHPSPSGGIGADAREEETAGVASQLRMRTLVQEAAAALQSRPGRTAGLAGTVALATGLVVATLGLASSASSQVSSRFDVQRSRDVTISLPTVASATGEAAADLPRDASERLAQVSGIVEAGVVERRAVVPVSTGLSSPPVAMHVAGVSDQALRATEAKITPARGQGALLGANQVLVGSVAAQSLGLGPIELEPTLVIDGRTFVARGLLTEDRRAPDLATAVLASPDDAASLSSLETATMYLATAPGAAAQVARQVPLALDPTHPERFVAEATLDPLALRGQIQTDLKVILVTLSVLAALGSIMSVGNAMLVGVLERAGELGLRRAIGARPRHLFQQVCLESTIVGVGGGLLGLAGGIFVVLTVTLVKHWVPVFDFRLAPLALVAGTAVGAIGGATAARRAGRIQPADALRL